MLRRSARTSTGLLLCTAAYVRAFSKLTDRLFEIPQAKVIHAGDASLPPLIECSPGAAQLPLSTIVKPPDADSLYEWMTMYGDPDGDPSWASVWPAAAALAAYVNANPKLVEGKRLVELGAGLGIPSLVAAARGARSATLMDREPLALHCALSTAECCGLTVGAVGDERDGVVSASVSDWGEFARQGGEGIDVVLAAEVLYDPSDAAPLAECVASLLTNDSGRAGKLLLADPAEGRAVGCRERLVVALEANGARVSVEPLARVEGLDPAAVQGDTTSKQELMLLTAEW
jgi:predicted nicotinamide N-methyase